MSDIKHARLPGVLKSRVSGGVSTFEKRRHEWRHFVRKLRVLSLLLSPFFENGDRGGDRREWPRFSREAKVDQSVVFRFKKRRFLRLLAENRQKCRFSFQKTTFLTTFRVALGHRQQNEASRAPPRKATFSQFPINILTY